MDTISITETINNIVVDYFATFEIQPVSIKYSIVDDMVAKYSELRPEHAKSEAKKIATLNLYNGTTIAPSNVAGMFTVLLNEKYMSESINQNNATWIGTIAHETTHVIDFTNFATLLYTFENMLDNHKYPI